MRKPILLATVLLLVLTIFARAGFAGPLEDADAADKRQDYATALRLVMPLAQQGDPGAQRRLGVMYASGRGVGENYSEAEKWFQKAAAQNELDAIWNLGFIHHRGRGSFPKDFLEAEKWYIRAAEQGHIGSQTSLAFAYSSGDGVEQDYPQAAKWYLRAANQGNFLAQHSLAMMYEMGQGVPQDQVLAYKWYNLAATHAVRKKEGDALDRFSQALSQMNLTAVAEARDRLARTITRSELAEAQKMTREWKPRPER
jgi:TPR repeat protein